ncbi:hypothetical protein HPB50_004392 [Hyalomma asiaticum]|uniref:Uncharacterized protein n=1 Tax=Hyalomma asiaticum TaxID=266040 RepID=A0ACB7RPB1_HYAAI|nr:hypothetical protein HPB50_004392 [Hyalomma asiaticum]
MCAVLSIWRAWRVEDWKYAIFSDESTFSSRWDQQKRVWRVQNTRFCPQNMKEVAASELLNLIMNEASLSTEELLKRDCVKVSIPLCMLNKLVMAPLERTSVLSHFLSDELPAMLWTIIC